MKKKNNNYKFKVCVYAICKNEEKFVEKWTKSMSEADEIYVLDTGSSDNTVSLLRKNNVHVIQEIINPWRFDNARNRSLELVPSDTDICVCTDLDEIFDKGWRKNLEEIWENNKINHLGYNYNWSFDENNKPSVNYYIEKIHTRNDFIWTHPVHEVLKYIGNAEEKRLFTDKITLNHHPDHTKSRNSYLPLLEISVKEDPNDDRNMHYLGREYMYYHEYNKAIDTLIKHLSLPKATWKDERCASMRFIARCYNALNRYEEARMWLDKAINEAPHLRDPYIERAFLEYKLKNWEQVYKYTLLALNIKTHEKTYINEPSSWNETPYDLLSISSYYLGNITEAIKWVNLALEINPNSERIQKNKEFFIKKSSN